MLTNKELYYASNIAYYIFNPNITTLFDQNGTFALSTAFSDYASNMRDAIDNHIKENNDKIAKLEVKSTDPMKPEERIILEFKIQSLKDRNEAYNTTLNYYEDIANGNNDISNWRILRIDDANKDNGCYAITLLPHDSDTAIIAFRGSESADFSDAMHDWAIADFGLFAGELTAQQNTANSIVEEILKDENLKDYNFVLTGHSLGGNLAMHAA